MGYMGDVFYATEVASPRSSAMFGAATSVADELQNVALYAIEIASPGASTLVADRKLIDYFYANEFASPRRR